MRLLFYFFCYTGNPRSSLQSLENTSHRSSACRQLLSMKDPKISHNSSSALEFVSDKHAALCPVSTIIFLPACNLKLNSFHQVTAITFIIPQARNQTRLWLVYHLHPVIQFQFTNVSYVKKPCIYQGFINLVTQMLFSFLYLL